LHKGSGAQRKQEGGGKMPYNYNALRGKIREVFGTQDAFATAMAMSSSTLTAKLKGRTDWKRAEIEQAMKVLDIPVQDVGLYFFTL
jgi:hypothetical protein